MKNKKRITITSTVLVGISSAMILTAIPLRALETTNTIDIENKMIHNNARAKTIYVGTFANPGGDGSQANPYNDFVTAYQAASDGDTIVLVNAVTIQNGGASNVFKFDKNISIVGDGTNSQLTSRVPIQLHANLSLSTTEFVTESVYLNGYSLQMKEVKTNKNNQQRISIYGGSSTGTTQSGNKSTLTIEGFKQNPIELSAIYAGNETGASTIPVDIQLISGVKVLGSVNASGKDSQVNASVNVFVGDVSIPSFVNTSNTSDVSLHFKNYVNTNGPQIQGYHDVKLENSKIVETQATAFTGISGKLELLGNSGLDISVNQDKFTANELVSEMTSYVILNKEKGQLKVSNKFTGAIDLRTPGGEATSSSGPVKLNWPYIEADSNSEGMIWFKKHPTQGDIKLEMTKTNVKQWSFIQNLAQPFIDTLTLNGNHQIDLDVYEHSFDMNALDEHGNTLQYTPTYEYELKDNTGTIISVDDIDVYDDGQDKLYLYVENDAIVPGMYTLMVTEKISGKKFEFQMQFYRNTQQNPYTISFDANGGTGNMNAQYVNVGDKVSLEMNVFQKEGYSFKGWATKKDGTVVYQDGQQIQDLATAGNTLTLYAVWEINSYNVVFQTQDGNSIQSQSVVFGTTVKEPITPIREGYTFKGWYADSTYQQVWDFNTQKMPAKDIVLYARWEKNSTIELNQAPIIHAEDRVIYVGDEFQPLADVYATDNEDGEIVLTEANIKQNTVNTKVAGIYYVTYEVKDSEGQVVTKTIKVTVKDKSIDNPTQSPDSNNNSSNTNPPSSTTQPDKQETGTPSTGDMSHLGLWGFLMTASAGFLGIVAIKKRKNSEEDI